MHLQPPFKTLYSLFSFVFFTLCLIQTDMKFSTDIFDSKLAKALKLAEKILLIALAAALIVYDQSTDLLLLQITLGLLAIVYFAFPFYTSTTRFIEINPDDFNDNDSDDLDEEPIEVLPEIQHIFSTIILPKVLWLSIASSVLGYLAFITFPQNDAYYKLIFVGGGTIFLGLLVLVYEIFKGLKDIHFLCPALFRAVPVALFDLYLLLSLH